MKVETTETPRVDEKERLEIIPVSNEINKVIVKYGFMESPNIPKAMSMCRQKGLKFDIMSTSFFLGRRKVVAGKNPFLTALQIYLFIFLMKNSTNATDFFKIPSGRVVELGTQVVI